MKTVVQRRRLFARFFPSPWAAQRILGYGPTPVVNYLTLNRNQTHRRSREVHYGESYLKCCFQEDIHSKLSYEISQNIADFTISLIHLFQSLSQDSRDISKITNVRSFSYHLNLYLTWQIKCVFFTTFVALEIHLLQIVIKPASIRRRQLG